MNELHKQHCVPCEGGVAPLSTHNAKEMLKHIPGWTLRDDGKEITREFAFKDFTEAMAFVGKVAQLAESEGHHPDIHIRWNKVRLDLATHAIGGLSMNDFIVATKVNAL